MIVDLDFPRSLWGDFLIGPRRPMRGMVPTDVYELAGAAEPRLSPDGRQVAHVRWRVDRESNDYVREVWIAAVDGSSPARQLSAEPAGRQAQPRWSPNGRQIAFTCAEG